MTDRDQRLREIAERVERAKDWRLSPSRHAADNEPYICGCHINRYDRRVGDKETGEAAYAVEGLAREDAPWLLAEVRRLEKRVADLEAFKAVVMEGCFTVTVVTDAQGVILEGGVGKVSPSAPFDYPGSAVDD